MTGDMSTLSNTFHVVKCQRLLPQYCCAQHIADTGGEDVED